MNETMLVRAPYRVVCGFMGVKDYRLAVPERLFFDGFIGHIQANNIIYEHEISKIDNGITECLNGFFDYYWLEAGISRPAELRIK